MFGSLMVGFFSSSAVNPAVLDGLFFGGDETQLGHQAVGVVCAGLWSLVWTLVICFFLEKTLGFRVSLSDELIGLDTSQHGEIARIHDITVTNTTVKHPEAFWQEMSKHGRNDGDTLPKAHVKDPDAATNTKAFDHHAALGGVTIV